PSLHSHAVRGITKKRKYADQKICTLKNVVLGRHTYHPPTPWQTRNERQAPRDQQQRNYRAKKSIQNPDAVLRTPELHEQQRNKEQPVEFTETAEAFGPANVSP